MEVHHNGHAASSTAVRDTETALYTALWHACAGPFVTVPRAGELVFYFPQGHIEQVEASENQAVGQQRPIYNIPWKILCRVINVQLKVDPGTDEVFAQVTLFPQSNQDENTVEYEPPPPPPRFHVRSFSKKLTASDTSTYGGLSVLKRHAEECLPPLDMSSEPVMRELIAKDLHGNDWRFQHIFRGQPKRHLLTSGWSGFVSSKRLVPGDTFVFLRDDNGGIGVGVRRGMIEQSNDPIHLNGVATAWEAISSGSTLFTVHHRPRSSPRAEFMIPFDQYIESAATNYSIGMNFEMRSERDTVEHRFTGTIMRIEDIDPLRWRESKWRCLEMG
ncbi:hypothetical protein MANES_04G041700v8 [Manihot esculenta]|uniref:Uncharacterized protein n=1 Tax=Manihot esculenta TaxID=3983 RepID=A0ACB7HUI5_MANES|nr:hypothetical protein MANES_04G041700v8 [Manihot esculenta]